jgi:hypothetical protein
MNAPSQSTETLTDCRKYAPKREYTEPRAERLERRSGVDKTEMFRRRRESFRAQRSK